MNLLNSTKVRLTIWYAGVLSFVLVLFAVSMYFFVVRALYSQTDSTMREIASSFENAVKQEFGDQSDQTDPRILNGSIQDATGEVSYENYRLIIFSSEKEIVAESKAGKDKSELSSATARDLLSRFTKSGVSEIVTFAGSKESLRVYYHPFEISGKRFYLLMAHPLDDTEALLERIRAALLISIPLALLSASFGGYLLMKKSFAPIAEMRDKAEEISARNLHERLPVGNEEDEIGRLAGVFNRLLSRLDSSFEQQQRFMADASHELRTPVAIIRGEAEVTLAKTERTSEEYRESVLIMLREAERMSKIIEDLFALARADSGEEPASLEEVFIEEILAETVQSFRSIARKNGLEIKFETTGKMPALADGQLLRRLFVILIDNAVKNASSCVRVSASSSASGYEIEISDDGRGIELESQGHIFERFYRVDKTRSAKDSGSLAGGGGAGLGLSISQWIAEFHHGSIELTRTDKTGTVFTIKFPSAHR
ncbi:MAG: ATP-binding protein [Pyrinomonadaceae bacterium]